MLRNVHLKNLALIEEAEIDFTKGLNIMTGETGSGKSIIIGSVNIALGEKANKGMIRTGEPYALSELLFTDCPEIALKVLDSLGIDRDGKNILISRKITADSSVSKINGESTTLSNLKKVTSLLADVHGQHDHQSLLDSANHVRILDDFAGDKVTGIKKALSDKLSAYKAARAEYETYNKDKEELEREISLLEYEADEIEKAQLISGEDLKLEESFKEMSRRQKTSDILNRIKFIFDDEASGLVASSGNALKEMADAEKSDPSLSSFKNALFDIDSLIKEFSHDISRYTDENAFDRIRLAEITERLDLINHLKSRYGNTIEDILEYESNCLRRLDEFKYHEENKLRLSKELSGLKADINSLARQLSAARKEAAGILDLLITENLKDLDFLNVEFRTDFDMSSKITKDGFDKIKFMISLNPGEPLKPLSAVASGGELSRIMLALKSALAESDHIETLIFDEIDTGISGAAAAKVASKMHSLSKSHQIICITHLPQIASKADSHFLIEKEVADGITISGVKLLDSEASVAELAKMMSAGEVTPAALEHARQLKNS